MLMAKKQEEVGIIGIIGAGPGRSSTKIQAAHCRLLKTCIEMCKIVISNSTKQVPRPHCRQ